MMKYLIASLIVCISCLEAIAQAPLNGKLKYATDSNMGLDTNKLAVDEQGNKYHFYQYKKLLMSGGYALGTQGKDGFPLAEYLLKKKDEQQSLQLYEMVKKQMAITSTMLQEGNKLAIEPLSQINPSKFDNKVIVLMFISPDCAQCMAGIDDLGNFIKKVYDPNKIMWVAVGHGDESPDRIQYIRSLLPYAYIIFNNNKIYDDYWITGLTTGYVITDKDHIIRFNARGQGGIITAVFKNKLTEVLK